MCIENNTSKSIIKHPHDLLKLKRHLSKKKKNYH